MYPSDAPKQLNINIGGLEHGFYNSVFEGLTLEFFIFADRFVIYNSYLKFRPLTCNVLIEL